jgi:hypothetical protein
VSEPVRGLPQASRPSTRVTSNDCDHSSPSRAQYSRDVKYTTWTALVFEALARTGDGSYGGVGLPAVAATLGFDGVTWDDFVRHEGMPNALMTAMSDLDRLGLVRFENVGHGNELRPFGRDVIDAGLASIWPELAKIHLSARETSFLAKLYEASAVDEERWADLLFADADEVAGLIGLDTGDRADLIRRLTFLGDLERKGLLEAGPRFAGAPTVERPTYVAAVLLTETVARDLDPSASAPGFELKPGPPRARGRPKGPYLIQTRGEIEKAYRRLWTLQGRRPYWSEVAKALDIDERTLRRRRQDFGLDERPIDQTPE